MTEFGLSDVEKGPLCPMRIDAHRICRAERYKSALARLGDFLVLAHMPNP